MVHFFRLISSPRCFGSSSLCFVQRVRCQADRDFNSTGLRARCGVSLPGTTFVLNSNKLDVVAIDGRWRDLREGQHGTCARRDHCCLKKHGGLASSVVRIRGGALSCQALAPQSGDGGLASFVTFQSSLHYQLFSILFAHVSVPNSQPSLTLKSSQLQSWKSTERGCM